MYCSVLLSVRIFFLFIIRSYDCSFMCNYYNKTFEILRFNDSFSSQTDDCLISIRPVSDVDQFPVIRPKSDTVHYCNFVVDEGMRVCSKIANYSKKWAQPINLSKTVVQVFHSPVQSPVVNIYMKSQRLQLVEEFKYLEFT